jgi:hypothetical protein
MHHFNSSQRLRRGFFLCVFAITCHAGAGDQPAPVAGTAGVELVASGPAAWHLRVDGVDFPIRGAGGAEAPGLLEKLKAAGGNCVRTWGLESLTADVGGGVRFIDRAHQLGLKVVPGIWLEHERHGFNYGDAAAVQRQRATVLAGVQRFKDHPAVLLWGLGNEMEGPDSPAGSVAAFKEVDELARIIKREDPRHPVMTVIAFNPAKIANVKSHCPAIDILGVNSYGGAAGAGEALVAAGWTKPFVVTEFGTRGPWEVAATPWGAALEPTSTEKARTFYATHRLVTALNNGKDQCLGTFAFLWGWKQERTPTWFGMFLPTLEKLPQVDAMTMAWTGNWPANRCPDIRALESTLAGKEARPGQTLSASIDVVDPDGDAMNFRWLVAEESRDARVGGDKENPPATFPGLTTKSTGPHCEITVPDTPGAYRLFVTVYDNLGSAATANIPFKVVP